MKNKRFIDALRLLCIYHSNGLGVALLYEFYEL